MSEGMFHNEGGWRPEVNQHDNNQLMRWRRKIEKDEQYVTQLLKLTNVSIALIVGRKYYWSVGVNYLDDGGMHQTEQWH